MGSGRIKICDVTQRKPLIQKLEVTRKYKLTNHTQLKSYLSCLTKRGEDIIVGVEEIATDNKKIGEAKVLVAIWGQFHPHICAKRNFDGTQQMA